MPCNFAPFSNVHMRNQILEPCFGHRAQALASDGTSKAGSGDAQDAERAGVIVDAEAPLAGARFIRGIAKRTLSAAGAALNAENPDLADFYPPIQVSATRVCGRSRCSRSAVVPDLRENLTT